VAKQTVTTHKRTMRGGTTVTVHQHKRRGLDPSRSWRNIRRGWKHQRKGNYGRFASWTALGVLEFGTWATFQGASRFLLMTALFAGGLSIALNRASGKDQP
jgi:hypothetical protein